jgi:membrane-associated phospholipid phosphatase
MGVGVLFLTTPSVAKGPCAAPWRRLDQNAREMATPASLVLVGTSLAMPFGFVPTGFDHELRVYAQTTLGGSYFPEPVSIAAPYVVYPALWLFYGASAAGDFCEGERRGAALVQGTSEVLLTVGLLKWGTGRAWPTGGREPTASDRLDYPGDARRFRPFQEGLAAFPSGHTAFFFAAASALRASSPDLGAARYLGYPVAAAVGFAMWWGDHHWASDVVSGALLGEAIGSAAGRTWSAETVSKPPVWIFLPRPDGFFAGVSGEF